jgi:phosphoglycolate phosphatase
VITHYHGHVSDSPSAASSAGSDSTPWTVGFDLDMTLIDSRYGIKTTYDMLAAETGVPIDSGRIITRLGPPVETELAHWFPADRIQATSDRYRELYARYGIAGTTALPGAHGAIAAVRARGGRAIVVTGKQTANARRNLDALDLAVDDVFGQVFAEEKGAVLVKQNARVYVGDHLGDVLGAHTAGALAVAVATGPYSAEQLKEAGAEVVLADLTGFPAWLDA